MLHPPCANCPTATAAQIMWSATTFSSHFNHQNGSQAREFGEGRYYSELLIVYNLFILASLSLLLNLIDKSPFPHLTAVSNSWHQLLDGPASRSCSTSGIQ